MLKALPGVGLTLMSLMACTTGIDAPDLGGLYNRSAMYHGERRNPIIVIPGILGSKLLHPESGTMVWGAFGGDYADPTSDMGVQLLSLPFELGVPLRDLHDDVVADGALDRVRIKLLGLPVELKSYAYILGSLGVGGYRDQQLAEAGVVDYGDDHFTCFQFAYDWRRDLAENARRLHEFIVERTAYIKAEMSRRYGMEDHEVKFDIVAHSMGGLLTRYYLRYGAAELPADGSLPPVTWEGARRVEQAILVGTPNAGSVEALGSLLHGAKFAPFYPRYASAILGSHPAIYQLLPRVRHAAVRWSDTGEVVEGLFDPALWEQMGWGLAAPDQAAVLEQMLPAVKDAASRRALALDHQAKCLRQAEHLHAALDVPAELPAGLQLHLFAGDAVDTAAIVEIDRSSGSMDFVATAPGDGTVARTSALMDERLGQEWVPQVVTPIPWSSVRFLFADHIGLTREPVFTDNVLYLLLEQPR